MSVTTPSLRRRISRSLVTVIFLSFFSATLSTPSFVSPASAALFGSTACSSDFTDTTNLAAITVSNYCVVRINGGTTTWTPPVGVQSLYVLAVGGGGGGGNNAGGGGGGGAVAYGKLTLGAATSVSISVGVGGAGGNFAGDGTSLMDGQTGGATSVIANSGVMSLTASGGIGGQTHWANNFCGGTGAPTNSATGGTISSSGAYAVITNNNGAVGGAWAASGVAGGAGGSGSSRNITGTAVLYGAGGGGGAWNSTGGAGGTTGGGAGGGSGTAGTAGTANTGSGGGGGGDGCSNGGAGGSGIVVIRWIPVPVIATPSNATSLAGRTTTFSTTVTSTTTLTRSLQWSFSSNNGSSYSDVSDGSGATTTSFTTGTNLMNEDGHRYRLSATDSDATISTVGSSVGGLLNVTFFSGHETDTSLNFNGTTQFAQAVDNAQFDITGAITVQAWVYMTAYNSSTWNMVVNKESSYELGVHGGVWKYALNGSGGWTGVSTGIPYTLNVWQHVAFTRAAGQNSVQFYLDGVLVFTGDADGVGTGSITNTSEYFTISGRRSVGSSTTSFFPGKIDEFRLFASARTQAEIQTDMHTYGPIDSASLRAYYDFNDGSGATLFNKAAGATSVTDLGITGSPTWGENIDIDTSSQPAYTQVKFLRSYLTASGGWKSPANPISYTSLVVAGGGAGGARVATGAGGGGGAGGMVETNLRTLDTSTVVAIRVGQGGVGSRTGTMTTVAPGSNGQNSFIRWGSASTESFTAIGGGGGAGGYGSTGDTSYRGIAGGSGGGASGSNDSGYIGGAAQQISGNGFSGYGNTGGSNPGCSGLRPAGGGGGAGSAGVTPQTCSPAASGAGGAGRTSTVTGAIYAGGGGGGLSGDAVITAGTGGSGGGATGSGGTLITGTTEYIGNAGSVNTGGGGGGVGRSSGIIRGGSGGSGIIVIKYLTTARPVFTGPTSDTTTAGLTHTFSVVGNAPSPLVRSYLWQSSTDTGSTWVAISIGTGLATANYTTPILETNTSGSRFQYRVVVTDTDTAGTFLVETSTGVFLTINLRISITGSYTPAKYGTSRTDTFTVDSNSGTGTKTIRRTSPARNFVTWDTATANTARVTVAPQLAAGIYYETLTVTDQETATLIHVVMITVLKADTATITVANRNDTYTASSLSYIDTFTVTGLVAGDSLTGVSYTYSGSANDGTVYANSARPALAGQYSISPVYTLVNASSYESVTVTSGTLTINRKLRSLAVTTSPATLKYGDTSTVIATTVDGAGDGLMSYLSSTTLLCQFSGAVLQALEATGNCQYTATIGRGNNFDTATTTSTSTTLALADTLTVTVQSITALTFTGSQAVVTPRISVSGFKLTDTTTVTSASFSYRIAGTTDSFTATVPTFSDTYTVRAETLTVTSGLLSRYRAITYVDGTLRINRAQQAPLVLPQFSSVFGTPYQVIVYGGSGTGDVIESVTAGTATGCLVVGDTVTTTTEGSCFLTVTKAQDRNYETATVSAFIYFITWVAPAAPTVGTGPTIALNGENTVIIDERRAPVITSFGDSGNASYPVAIYGGGFLSATAGVTEVKFWRDKSLNSSDFVIVSDSLIWSRQASGATKGKIYVINENGMAISPTSYTPFVVISI